MTRAWLIIGFVGQIVFSLRFLVQWVASERCGKSVIPVAFWHISLLGSSILLAYAVYRRDPVFILGQSFGAFIYIRNLMLIFRSKPSLEKHS
ncbi:MAG: hypothetical protein C4520_10855 [Candidatus Abyssobacteria bacterium SURF_5]|jgi:lipid-A-disaccharide synthase-like uncharacterized protein|uniref:Lipid A biosynthesis N-terminal domain-containing protein n=1 Tax=Abyssobacteria bacterium (strain SURF_5) TaxID=2093360 RepID=A0A3A4NP88_ABYX5|nr:MAG: hypothetical protein C4520_10855 [Candidatus Abyssubacteria bacterium SURF_5]